MKSLVLFLIAFSVFSIANAGGPKMIKKEFKCSVLADYSVYIEMISGITNSYRLIAICLNTKGTSLESCLSDEDDDTYTCMNEFNELNKLGAGDGELVIVHGRED